MTVATKTIDLFRVFMAEDAKHLVGDTLDSGYVGQGERVEEFEREFGALVDAPRPVVSTDSCTSALTLALHLLGVGPGDDVIGCPMSCAATYGPVVTRGARIVWADSDPVTALIDPRDVARKVTRRTKAIIGVNWAGRRCDFAALRALGVPTIEDAAHGPYVAPGGGDFVAYSFGPIKHLTCGGHGGALVCPDDETTERAELLRWHGLSRRSSADFRCSQDITEAGYKMHLTDVDAAIGLANLPHLHAVLAAHRDNALFYDEELVGLPGLHLPPPDLSCAYWLYSILVRGRDEFMAFMAERAIATSRVHRRCDAHPAYGHAGGPLPGVDIFDGMAVALPVGWWIGEGEREYIAGVVREWSCRQGGGK